MTEALKSKKILITAGVALLVLVLVWFAVQATGGGGGIDKQLSLGDKYLAALDYDNAIMAFTKALSIDPKNLRAYRGLASSYLGQGNLERAVCTVRDGAYQTGDDMQDLVDDMLTGRYNTLPPGSVEIQIANSHNAVVRLTDPDGVQSGYMSNHHSSKRDYTEHSWSVSFGASLFSTSTTVWAFDPGLDEVISIEDMQHTLWRFGGDSRSKEAFIPLGVAGDSLYWTIAIPEQEAFDFYTIPFYFAQIYHDIDGQYVEHWGVFPP